MVSHHSSVNLKDNWCLIWKWGRTKFWSRQFGVAYKSLKFPTQVLDQHILEWCCFAMFRWWFHMLFFHFLPPIPGEIDIIWRSYFSNGLVQPPTSYLFFIKHGNSYDVWSYKVELSIQCLKLVGWGFVSLTRQFISGDGETPESSTENKPGCSSDSRSGENFSPSQKKISGNLNLVYNNNINTHRGNLTWIPNMLVTLKIGVSFLEL